MDEQDIPIDISTSKLLDWLISRRHVNKEWQTPLLKIREKINNAIQDMPEHKEIIKLLSGQHINYFHCLKIVEILKETEADSKNLFGRYGSQRMKDWQEIVNLYQRDNIYLAECAQMLIRNVIFEVPGLRKQASKLEQTQTEYGKKIKDYTKAENIALNDFNTSCKQLGINGDNIKRELIELLQDLPGIYKNSAGKIKMVRPALEFYEGFVKFNSGKDIEVLSTLKYLITNGNTTTYEYTYGEKPITVVEEVTFNFVDESSSSSKIDFGDSDNVIDFGDLEAVDLVSTPTSEADIDWGTLNTDEEFEIVDHVDLDINLEESGIVVEKTGVDGGVAKGSDAFTILDNSKTRELILTDLMELETFLKIRLYEMSTESDLLSMSQLDVPMLLQLQTIESVTSMFDSVVVSISDLCNKRTLHLHNVKHSAKYVDILAASLKQKLDVVERMKGSKKVVEEQTRSLQKEMKSVAGAIEKVIQNSRDLQKHVEEDLSKKYKGRQVHLVGGRM